LFLVNPQHITAQSDTGPYHRSVAPRYQTKDVFQFPATATAGSRLLAVPTPSTEPNSTIIFEGQLTIDAV